MPKKIKQIVDSIRSTCPDCSEADVESAVVDYIENNFGEILSKIKLPEKQTALRPVGSKGFRRKILERKLYIEYSKKVLTDGLELIYQELTGSGQFENASNIVQDIREIDEASSRYKAVLLNTDVHLAKISQDRETKNAEVNETIKKLERLANDSK